MDFTEEPRPVWTDEERAEIADEYDQTASFLDGQAARLEAAGNPTAETVRRGAQEARDLADAARTSNSALARLY